jgi:Fur family transcriptional regulator, peroxide stress response regulator
MQHNRHEVEKRAFLEICQQYQLKVTPQRMVIYNELLQSDVHPSADAIYQSVKRQYPNISYDTVNRTLLTFAEIGVVDVLETFGGAKRFDPQVTPHHHLHCTQCGKVIDFYSPDYDNLAVPESVGKQFRVISKRVVLRGICQACQT